jgi:hypothetical protein
MPGYAYSYYALGFLSLVTGENLKEGAELLRTALKLEPQNKHFALTRAQLQARMHDYEGARKTLEPLLAADSDPNVKVSAESTLKMIEYMSRPASASSGPVPTSAEGTRSETSSSEAPATQAAKAPARVIGRPTLKFEGTQTIRAFLVSIECKSGKWTLVVNTHDGLARFAVSDKDKLEFYSQDPDFEGKVSCGTVNKIAFIYFKPMADQAKFAGDAVAVEFTR